MKKLRAANAVTMSLYYNENKDQKVKLLVHGQGDFKNGARIPMDLAVSTVISSNSRI